MEKNVEGFRRDSTTILDTSYLNFGENVSSFLQIFCIKPMFFWFSSCPVLRISAKKAIIWQSLIEKKHMFSIDCKRMISGILLCNIMYMIRGEFC